MPADPRYPRPRGPHRFVCDVCGHTVTFYREDVSLSAKPCLQDGCTGWLRRVKTPAEHERKQQQP